MAQPGVYFMGRTLDAPELSGCFVAIVTPYRNNERLRPEINYDALDSLAEQVLESNVCGIVVSGCTGSAYGLSIDEQVKFNTEVNQRYRKITRIIAGDGGNTTWETIEMAKRIEGEAGIFTHLVISPYYNKPSDRGLVNHYLEVANSLEGNIILYSVPSRTGGKGITPSVVKELWEHPQIIGIKEASGNLERIASIVQMTCMPKFSVLSGDDALALQIMKLGGRGHISVAGNIAPVEMAQVINYAILRDYERAERINSTLNPLYSALFPKHETENPSPNPSTTHYALRRLGIDVGVPRLPLEDCSSEEKIVIDNALEGLGFIEE